MACKKKTIKKKKRPLLSSTKFANFQESLFLIAIILQLDYFCTKFETFCAVNLVNSDPEKRERGGGTNGGGEGESSDKWNRRERK